MKYLGKHYILELYDCPADLLSDPTFIEVKNECRRYRNASNNSQ